MPTPKSALGKWSVGFILAFIISLAVLMIMAASGQTGGDTLTSNLKLAIPGLLAGFCALSSLVTGAIAIVRSKERSTIVLVATIIGLLVFIFLLGEFLFPH